MNNHGGNYRQFDAPTEYNYQSHTFVPLSQRRRLQNTRQQVKQKPKTRFYAAVTSLLVLLNVFIYSNVLNHKSTSNVLGATNEDSSPITLVAQTSSDSAAATQTNPSPNSVQPVSRKYNSLETAVNTALDGAKGDYAFVIKHLETGESYARQPDKQYEPGSLYKLWVMAAVFEQMKNGSLSEDQELSRSISFLNQSFGISAEDAEQKSGSISLTVNQALNQMIVISHNYAAMLLTEKIKLSTVKAFLAEEGFKHSQVGSKSDTPKTTAADIALFYERLYNKSLVSEEASTKMIELLKKQEKRNKLPLYLPEDVELAHKTGELGMVSHDAGIVYTPKGNYIIVAMSETGSPKGAEDRIGKVSQAVYEYFSQ